MDFFVIDTKSTVLEIINLLRYWLMLEIIGGKALEVDSLTS